MGLTPKQARVVEIIANRIERTKIAPTLQEIADEIGCSKITVYEHVQACIKKGHLIQTRKGSRRGLEVIRPRLDLGTGYVRVIEGGTALRLVNREGRAVKIPATTPDDRRYRLILEVVPRG